LLLGGDSIPKKTVIVRERVYHNRSKEISSFTGCFEASSYVRRTCYTLWVFLGSAGLRLEKVPTERGDALELFGRDLVVAKNSIVASANVTTEKDSNGPRGGESQVLKKKELCGQRRGLLKVSLRQ